MGALSGQEDPNGWSSTASTPDGFSTMTTHYWFIAIVLKLRCASESLGKLIKIHIAEPHT